MKTISDYNLVACPRCYHIWQPRKARPKLCPSCKRELSEVLDFVIPGDIVQILDSAVGFYDFSNAVSVLQKQVRAT